MTDYHKLWTSPSGIQSSFSAASGPSAVAMATVWLVPAELGKQEWSGAGSAGLQAGCQLLPGSQLWMSRHTHHHHPGPAPGLGSPL